MIGCFVVVGRAPPEEENSVEGRAGGRAGANEDFRTTPSMTISSLRRVLLANNDPTNSPISMDMGDAAPPPPNVGV